MATIKSNYIDMYKEYGTAGTADYAGLAEEHDEPEESVTWSKANISTKSYDAPISLPSSPVNLLGIPAPRAVSANFVYNFWEPDEVTNEEGFVSKDIFTDNLNTGTSNQGGGSSPLDIAPNQLTSGEKIHAGTIKAAVPRWIEIGWKRAIINPAKNDLEDMVGIQGVGSNSTGRADSAAAERNILQHLRDGTMVDQTALMSSIYNSSPFVDFAFQDADLPAQLSAIISRIVDNQLIDSNSTWNKIKTGDDKYSDAATITPSEAREDASDTKKQILKQIHTHFKKYSLKGFKNSTMSEQWSNTAASVIDNIFSSHGQEVVPGMEDNPIVAYDPNTYGDYKGTPVNALDRVEYSGIINGKFVGDISEKMANNPWGPFFDSISKDVGWAKSLQAEVVSNPGATQITQEEYDVFMPILTALDDSISEQVLNDDVDILNYGNFVEKVEVYGYFFEKYEVGYSSTDPLLVAPVYENKMPIVVGGGAVESLIDTKVKLGATYYYRPRTVVRMIFNIPVPEDNHVYRVPLLLASPAGTGVTVEAMNNAVYTPPQPPGDLRFVWDYDNEWLTIFWSFPINPQRDIKYFKVYRRASTHEPFQLMAMYDFNDSSPALFMQVDYILPSLVEYTSRTWYRDREFTKESTFIYSIVSADAHGLSSNYSAQYAVYWDPAKNKIRVDPLSPPGAPEPYPNFMLRENLSDSFGQTELTKDLVKSSNRDRAYLLVDPECPMTVIIGEDGEGVDEKQTFLWDPDAESLEWSDYRFPFNEEPGLGTYVMTLSNLDMHKHQIIKVRMQNQEFKTHTLQQIGDLFVT